MQVALVPASMFYQRNFVLPQTHAAPVATPELQQFRDELKVIARDLRHALSDTPNELPGFTEARASMRRLERR